MPNKAMKLTAVIGGPAYCHGLVAINAVVFRAAMVRGYDLDWLTVGLRHDVGPRDGRDQS